MRARGESLEYVRRTYGVRADKGRRVTIYNGKDGTIVGGRGHYLRVLVDGDERPITLHPTWRVTYHDEVLA